MYYTKKDFNTKMYYIVVFGISSTVVVVAYFAWLSGTSMPKGGEIYSVHALSFPYLFYFSCLEKKYSKYSITIWTCQRIVCGTFYYVASTCPIFVDKQQNLISPDYCTVIRVHRL